MQLDPPMPGDLRDRVGQLLEPRLVGAAAVVQHRRREHDEDGIARAAVETRRRGRIAHDLRGLSAQAYALHRHVGVDAPVLQRIAPEFLEALPAPEPSVETAPAGLEVVLERPGLPGQPEQHVAGVPRPGKHRLHHRLLQRPHARTRAAVVPLLEGVQVREHEIGGARRLVQVGREADTIAHLAPRLPEGGGERVTGVCAVHEQQRDLPRLHPGDEVAHLPERPPAFDAVIRSELYRPSHGARDVIEDVHRGHDLGTVRVMGRHPSGHRQPTTALGPPPPQLPCQPFDHRRIDADCSRHCRRCVPGEQRLQPARVRRNGGEPLAHDDRSEREGEQPLGARRRRHPLVGIQPRERHARPHVHELRHPRLPGGEAVRLAERVLIADGGQPGVEEVGTEGEDVAGAREVVPRHLGRAEGDAVAFPQRLERERLVGDVRAARRPGPLSHEVPEASRLISRDESDALATGGLDLGTEPRQRVVPGDRLQLSLRAARQWLGNTVRIVDPLQRRLAAGAEVTVVDRRLGVPLELDHAPFAYLGVDAAPARALAAGRRVPGGDAGHLVLRLHEVGHELPRRLRIHAAGTERGRAAPRHAQDREEPAAVHLVAHGCRPPRLSSDI